MPLGSSDMTQQWQQPARGEVSFPHRNGHCCLPRCLSLTLSRHLLPHPIAARSPPSSFQGPNLPFPLPAPQGHILAQFTSTP